MPDMYEIYDQHADRYDELVGHEDFDASLRAFVRKRLISRGMTVVEAGIGTGRVTRTYVDLARQVLGFDRSSHMLEQAARNLAPWTGKLVLAPADHLNLPVPDGTADLFLEGWAFGHRILDTPDEVPSVTALLVSEAQRVTRADGSLVFFESLGTNVDEPHAPHDGLARFFELLETEHSFEAHVLRTDYRFESLDEASRICGFFFGEEMARGIRERRGRGTSPVIVPEFTGVWVR